MTNRIPDAPPTLPEHPIVAAGTMPDAGAERDLWPQGGGLPLADLEAVYDALADAIDQAGPAASERLLVKLALLSAQAIGDRARFEQLLRTALADL